MKDHEIRIRTDKEFIEKVDYLQQINDYKNRSDTVRKVVEKEYRKETMEEKTNDKKRTTCDTDER